jgi:ATP-dependent Lon protease
LGDVMKESVKIALSWIKANFNTVSMLSQQVVNIQETID